jgi:manganese/iron transport system substrate-binding protein
MSATFKNQSRQFLRPTFMVLITLIWLNACTPAAGTEIPPSGTDRAINVVATTTILGDVVRQIGGDTVSLSVLLPEGSDPHTYQPTPQDLIKVSDADVIFINGAGLESFLERLLENAGKDKIVSVSEGIPLRQIEEDNNSSEPGHEHTGTDPHVWFDPQHVETWVKIIETKLSSIDPANAANYAANAEAYQAELQALDAWITEQVAMIPAENRKLVTDHQELGYFADRYGFELVGAVIPSFSVASEPSAEEVAALEDAIQAYDVPAIFIGTTVSPGLAQRIATDTGARLVTLYTGTLTDASGEAGSYLELMRFDVQAIVEALR